MHARGQPSFTAVTLLLLSMTVALVLAFRQAGSRTLAIAAAKRQYR